MCIIFLVFEVVFSYFFFRFCRHLIEIAGGIGPTVGKLLRIGTMGYNAYPDRVDKVLSALKEGLEFAKLQQSRI